MKRSLSLMLWLQIFISLFLIVILQLDLSIKVNQVILAFVFIECCIISCSDKFFNIYQIFLGMVFFFNLAIPIFNLLGAYEFPAGNAIMNSSSITTSITEAALSETYKVLIVFLLGTSVGWVYWLKKNRNKQTSEFLINDSAAFSGDIVNVTNIPKWHIQLFYILLPIQIIYCIVMVRYSIEDGYVAAVFLHTRKILYIFTIVNYIYPLIGSWLLFRIRDKKNFIKYSIIFLLPYLIRIFTGQRGETISLLLAILFIYSTYFHKIGFKKVVIAFLIILFVIMGIGTYRWSRNVSDLFVTENLFDQIVNVFTSNSSSMAVLSYTIQLKDTFTNNVPFLFGYIFAIFSFSSNYTVEGILSKSYLAQHITYLLKPSKLLGGSTIGTAIAAEFYELAQGNLLIIFILSILLFSFTGIFIKNLYKNPLWFYFGFSYLQELFLSPRGSVMKIFNKISLVYVFVFIIMNYFLEKNNRKLK